VGRALGEHPEIEYRIVEPLLSGAAGAVLMALEAAGYPVTDSVREMLQITSPPSPLSASERGNSVLAEG